MNPSLPVDTKTWKESVDELCIALGMTKGELHFLLSQLPRHYHSQTKTSPCGKQRTFYIASEQMRSTQRRLRTWLDKLPVHDAAHGWREGRSPKTAAAVHVGKPCVVNLDIADFFPSVTHYRIYNLYVRLGCVPDVARVLTKLTTWQGHLAQGLITSPVLANLVMVEVDARVDGICRRLKFACTRYGDDITISGSTSTQHVVSVVKKILKQSGFDIKQEKFTRQTQSDQQSVVGVVVNSAPNLPKETRRKYRAIAHNCRTRGLTSEQREGEELKTTKARVRGYLSHWAQINPAAAQSSLAKFCIVELNNVEANEEQTGLAAYRPG